MTYQTSKKPPCVLAYCTAITREGQPVGAEQAQHGLVCVCACVCVCVHACVCILNHDGCALRKPLIYNDTVIVVLMKYINQCKYLTFHFLLHIGAGQLGVV